MRDSNHCGRAAWKKKKQRHGRSKNNGKSGEKSIGKKKIGRPSSLRETTIENWEAQEVMKRGGMGWKPGKGEYAETVLGVFRKKESKGEHNLSDNPHLEGRVRESGELGLI